MNIEMGASQPLLLKPTCPSVGEPGITNFLSLVQALVPVDRVELILEPVGGAQARTYLAGSGAGPTKTVVLEAGPDFKAALQLSRGARLGDGTVSLLSGALTTVLDHHRLIGQTSILRAALDTTSSSILLFDGRGDIVYANPPADELLSLQTEDELLAETDDEPRQPLFSLLGSLVERTAGSAASTAVWKGRLRTADGRLLACEVSRLPRRETRADAVVVLMQPIGTESEILVDAFSSNYGLSPREQEVLQLLVDGATTVTIAERLGISPHTVRDHLKHLYRKTETSSRSELLGLLSRANRSV